ncbi:MAG: YggS family pyridoxal phosphate-dependent enzyme [Flavobacteriales bacterium]
MELYNNGHRNFGENKVQELISKQKELPEDIKWHFIGHLQRNKVKYLAPFVHMIHSVDSLKLLKEVDKRGRQNERVIDCLLQMRIASEETKHGMLEKDIYELLNSEVYKGSQNIRICGLMGMATHTDNSGQIKEEFEKLSRLFYKLKQEHFKEKKFFREISIGMTHDYSIAIESGSTMVRIGSAIFGKRVY